MDYSKLSDAQLTALHTGDYSKLSNDELVGLHQTSQPAPEMGWGEYIGRGVTGALPVVGGAVGGMAGAAARRRCGQSADCRRRGSLGYAGGKELERLGNHYAFGDELPDESGSDTAKRVGVNLAEGGAAEAGGQILSKAVEAANPVREYIANKLGGKAEKLAVNATGATAAQASKFEPDAGRELLDQGIVRFGSTPESIAERSGERMASAQQGMDSALSQLDAQGVKATPDEVQQALFQSRAPLQETAGTLPAAQQAEKIASDVAEVQGDRPLSLSEIEAQKRSFSKTNWQNPDVGQGQKATYRGLRDLVEQKATEASPELANTFKTEKDAYGLFEPIQEAAERRVLKEQQRRF
jgi:hypothetical protein